MNGDFWKCLLFDPAEDVEIGNDEDERHGQRTKDGGDGAEHCGNGQVIGRQPRFDVALKGARFVCGGRGHDSFVLSVDRPGGKRGKWKSGQWNCADRRVPK